jgi:P-type conjugative transfer protein TrbJ
MLPAKAGLRRVLAVAAALTLALPMPRAQTVFCTNCSTELTQLANNIQLVDQLARQVELVREAIAQTTNLTLNTQTLTGQEWSGAIAEIRKLNEILAQAKSLSFTATDLDAQFALKYRDYSAYVAQQPDAETLGTRLQQWSEDTNDSVLTTLKVAGLSARQIEGEEASYLLGLERLAETAEGRMQAIQVGNQIATAAARQTQKLRHIMLIQVQLLAGFVQRQSDREATEAAAWRNFSKPLDLPAGNGRRY